MDRRARGGLLLATAVVIVGTVPRLLNPLTVTGAAAIAPPPPPPAVGSCLAGGVTSSWGARGVLRPADTVYVGCDRPHRAEIIRMIDPLPSPSTSETVFDLCTRDVDPSVYLGIPASDVGWRPELQVRVTASGPDARQAAAGQNWAACVLVDDVGRPLTTPLAGSAITHTIPAQVGVCFDGSSADLAFRGSSPCDAPHGGELFAGRPVDGTTDPAALTASCRELVIADVGRPALVEDPSLVVEAVVSDEVTVDASTGSAPGGPTGTARCVVRALDGRQLAASLRGLDAAPVPWAG